MNDAVDALILEHKAMAEDIGNRYPGRGAIDRDDLRSEAWLALVELANRYAAEGLADEHPDFPRWAAPRIRDHLRKLVRDQIYAFLADVPESLVRQAIRVHNATECLKRRAVLRPGFQEIADEARVDVLTVQRLSAFNAVITRQSSLEWSGDVPAYQKRDVEGEVRLWPLFGVRGLVNPVSEADRRDLCRTLHPDGFSRKSLACCMVCDCSGQDHLRAVRRPPAHELPPPEEAPAATKATPAATRAAKPLTRKQARRQMVFPPAPVLA